jgi:hypothetical protein
MVPQALSQQAYKNLRAVDLSFEAGRKKPIRRG